MITTNVPTLKIHKLTQAQYDRELANGNIDENALYLTPEDNTASGGGTYIIPMDFDYNIDSSFSFSWDELLAAIDNNYYVAIRIEDSEGYYRDYIFNRDMRSDNEIIFVHIDQ